MKKVHLFLVVLALVIIGNNKIIAQSNQNNKWLAPKYSNDLINPFKGKESATAEGKKIFNQMCVLCHGTLGQGNGEAGVSLEKKPANFLALKVINESDGAIFWKITHGNPPMASYEGLLSEEQRWKLVNYIRELEKK
jgi:mono/diheme cytochrome c family protein